MIMATTNRKEESPKKQQGSKETSQNGKILENQMDSGKTNNFRSLIKNLFIQQTGKLILFILGIMIGGYVGWWIENSLDRRESTREKNYITIN